MAEDEPYMEQGHATYQLLKEITNNFSKDHELGQGASGRVYRGELKNGKKVAVKLFHNASPQLDEQIFKNEFENLKMLKHQNTVQFVGYCYETQHETAEHNGRSVWAERTHRALCFEYLHNGNLKMHLDDESCGIDWNTRYKIIKGTCEGLKYIHKELGIYHLDLKPENILLDEKMVPKLADFGFSKIFGEDITQTITNFNVTCGYVPPEYIERCHISNKFDIFSLGVVIIKIVTGPMGYSKSADMSDNDFTVLAEEKWRNRLGAEWKGSLLEAYCQQVKRCIELALNCVEKDRNKRPSIEDIIEKLNETENLIDKLLRNGQQKAEEKWRNRLGAEWNGSLLEAYCQQVKRCIELALKRMEKDRDKRPSIEDVIEKLNDTENSIDKLLRNDQLQKKWLSGDNGTFIGNLFQFVRSFQWSTTEEPKLHEHYVMQLQSDLQCLYDTLPAIYHLIHRVEWSQDDRMEMLLRELRDAVYDAEDLLNEFRWYEQKVSVEGIATSVHPVIDFFRSVTSFNKVSDIQKRLDNLSNSTELEQIGLDLANTQLHRPETTSFIAEPKPKVFGRDNELKELMRLLGVPANGSGAPKSKRKRSGVIALTGSQVCTTLDIKYKTREDEYGTREEDSVEEYGSPKDGSENEYRTSERDSEESSEDKAIIKVHVVPIVGIGGIGKTTLAQTICNSTPVRSHFDMIIWICVSDDFDVKRLTKEAIISSSGREATTDRLDSLQKILADNVNKKRLLLILDDVCVFDRAHWMRFCAPFTNVIQGSMMLVTTRFQQVADLVRTMDPFPLQGLQDDAFWDFFKQCVFGPDSSGINPNLECIGKTILPKLSGSPLAAKTLGRLLGMRLDPQHWNNVLMSELWQCRQGENDIFPALRLSYKYLPFYLKRCFSFCAVYPKHYEFEKVSLAEIWVAEGFVEPHGSIPILDIGCKYFEELVQRSFFQTVGPKYVIPDLMHEMARLVSKDECFIIKNFSDIQKVPQNVRHLSILQTNGVACSDLLSLGNHRKLRTLLCKIPLCNKTDTSMLDRWCAEFRFMRVIVFAQIRELPKSIGNMKHLRYLEILRNSHHLERLPSEICFLYNLQRIYARNCVFDNVPSRFARLINLQRFEALGFRFNDYPSESLPTWFHPRYVPNIRSLSLNGCNELECISLPGNSRHRHPMEVPAEQVDSMVGVSTGSTFLSLVDISIENCKNLSSLEQFLQPAYIPLIKKIVIAECPSLELIPAERFGDLSFLEVLKVCDCPKIKSQRLLALSLKKLELKNSGNLGDNIECCSLSCLHLLYSNLASIELQEWNLPVVQELKISHCSSLTFIQESKPISTDVSHAGAIKCIGKFPLITHLTIEYCNQLETLDDQLLYLPAVKSINISFCDLLSLPTEKFESFSFLKDLTLSNCVRLSWESGTELPLSLKTLSLQNCGDISTWFTNCLENLTSLESLHFGHCDYILSIPDHLWSCNLKSLKKLRIESCPDLETIGGPTAIANIENVWIEDCPKLEEVNQPLVRGIGFDRSPLSNLGCGIQIKQMDNMEKTYEQLDPENTVNSVREALLYDKFKLWLSSKCEQNIDGDHVLPKQYYSIIHMIAALGHVLALKPLLSSGVPINYCDANGWTALHWAARFGREDMVVALIVTGALSYPTLEDHAAKTPASIASAYGFKGLSAFLSEVQLTTHLCSVESKENGKLDSEGGGICGAVDRTLSKSSHVLGRPDDQRTSLSAIWNAVQAAARIKAAFGIFEFRKEKEMALHNRNSCCLSISETGSVSHDMLEKAALSIQKNFRCWKKRKEYLMIRNNVVRSVESKENGKLDCEEGGICHAVDIISDKSSHVLVGPDDLLAHRNAVEALIRFFSSDKRKEMALQNRNSYCLSISETGAVSHGMPEKAALSIQKNFRCWKKRKEFLQIQHNVVRIQALVRAHQARKNFIALVSSAVVLEKVMIRRYRKGVGLRVFNSGATPNDEEVDEYVAKVFRKLEAQSGNRH